ncbi:MAG: hypothetical protein ABIY62_09925 [Ginsengibacter sp.]
MLYLLWGLINVALFGWFIVICFRATKLVRANLGLLATIVFVFGLLSFIGMSGNNNNSIQPNSSQSNVWKFASEDTLGNHGIERINIDLKKNLISIYNLTIIYGKDKNLNFNIPISASYATTGVTCGTNWQPNSIYVNRTADNNKFEYAVFGTIKWKLLGATIFSQGKNFVGYAATN